jgi:hypothetical protein
VKSCWFLVAGKNQGLKIDKPANQQQKTQPAGIDFAQG